MSNILAIHCFYRGNNSHELEFVSQSDLRSYAIYEYNLKTKEKGKCLLRSDLVKTEFQADYNQDQRQYFLYESEDDSLVFSHRIVTLNGMFNVRDMGGYLCQNGQRTQWGKIYRGDHLINLKEDSFAKFLSLGVDTIIDLRSADEINTHPNPYLNQYQTVYCDPNAHTAAFAGILQDLDGNDEHLDFHDYKYTKEQAILQMESQQRRFVYELESKDAFSRMLRTVSSPETSISYQHCRGGKDRTGFSMMLIQEILAVHPQLIIEDYMLTKRARYEKNKQYKERFLKLAKNNQAVADYLYMHFDTRESFILAAHDEIYKHHDSVQDYVKKELKIDETLLESMRLKYLE